MKLSTSTLWNTLVPQVQFGFKESQLKMYRCCMFLSLKTLGGYQPLCCLKTGILFFTKSSFTPERGMITPRFAIDYKQSIACCQEFWLDCPIGSLLEKIFATRYIYIQFNFMRNKILIYEISPNSQPSVGINLRHQYYKMKFKDNWNVQDVTFHVLSHAPNFWQHGAHAK